MQSEIETYPIDVAGAELDDLCARLRNTRWPDKETPEDWSQGIPLAHMREISAYWQNVYDWRRCEKRLNDVGSFVTEIDGLRFHFLHKRSKHENARPLILTHGWPGSIVEFLQVIPMLTDPTAYGGVVDDAFHVVVPSLPGYGFSQKPDKPGWKLPRIAEAWKVLMARLGYESYLAQGGDWGAGITTELGIRDAEHCRAIHLNYVVALPDAQQRASANALERAELASMQRVRREEVGYAKQQATRPQTLGYGLVDSPIGQAAWILEKLQVWTDGDASPQGAASRDELLDNVMMYWLTGSGASAARLYWESYYEPLPQDVTIPVGCSIFPREILHPPRRWAECRFKNIIYWGEPAKGGHFAALEQPRLFVGELRKCFALVARS